MSNALFGAAVAAFLAIAALSASVPVKADTIGLTVAPTRLLIGESQRPGGTILVANRSDRPMRFRVQLRPAVAGEPDPGGWIKVAPRSMVLAPGEAQTLRVIAHVPPDFAGERRAYVTVVPSPVEEAQAQGSASLDVLTSPVIPIIMRAGNPEEPTISVEAPARVDKNGLVAVTARRLAGPSGISSHGDLAVCDAAGTIGRINATTIWPEVASREYLLKPTREVAGAIWAMWIPRRDGAPVQQACRKAVAPQGR